MEGRIFGIKKSYILTAFFAISVALFVSLSLLSIFVYKLDFMWFFIFCLCTGGYQLLKGVLFKFDSAFFFGVLLLFIGGSGVYAFFMKQSYFQSVYYILSFSSASYFTYAFFDQKFHLYLSILLYFATILWFLTKIKIISVLIFVAILLSSVLIFIVGYTLLVKFKSAKAKGES